MGILDNYEAANEAFKTGAVLTQSNETLLTLLHGLSNQNNINSGTQHRDIIRGITINHILLQRHIDGLNKQNSKIQRWVIALAVAALISSLAQVVSPHLFPAQPIVILQPAPVAQSAPPHPAGSPIFRSSHKEIALNITYQPNEHGSQPDAPIRPTRRLLLLQGLPHLCQTLIPRG